jgi:2-polyprenyl-3-methyl-5-hydroxy-6-metoxy-1,4-benzoquinol methylase
MKYKLPVNIDFTTLKIMPPYSILFSVYEREEWQRFSENIFGFINDYLRKKSFKLDNSLDLACGIGTFVELLLEQGVDVYGIDVNADKYKIVQKNNMLGKRIFQKDIREFNEDFF